MLREGIEQHVAPTESGGPADYLLSPDRLIEADAIEPCVVRLATAEIDTPDGPGIGRGAGANRTAPLATKLGSALDGADRPKREAARAAVLRVLAVGYGGVVDLEAAAVEGGREITVRPDEPEVVWSRWVGTLDGGGAGVKRVHRQSLGVLHRLGAHALLEELRAAGMAPRFRPGRLRHIAWWYVDAGLSLRALQTDLFDDATPEAVEAGPA